MLYRQRRIGKNYVPFDIYKFVTMRADSPKYGTITARDDPRVLPVGKVLRKTKINELPQLFNILFGHMSIVGPRPLTPREVDKYPDDVRPVVYRDNQPGLTGMGSLFFRDEEDLLGATGKDADRAYREDIMPIKGALEVWYRGRRSTWLDMKLVVLTAWAVVSPRTVRVVEAFRGERVVPEEVLAAYERLVAQARERDRESPRGREQGLDREQDRDPP